MTKNVKEENGVTYRIAQRDSPSMAEYSLYWRGDDGSTLELTYDEKAERDTSKSLAD